MKVGLPLDITFSLCVKFCTNRSNSNWVTTLMWFSIWEPRRHLGIYGTWIMTVNLLPRHNFQSLSNLVQICAIVTSVFTESDTLIFERVHPKWRHLTRGG